MWSILIFTLLSSTLHATDRFYADVNAFSENGKYKLIAQSPDNRDGKLKPFSNEFEFILFDVSQKKPAIIWRRPPKDLDIVPIDAFVSNDGTTVIYDEVFLLIIDKSGRDEGIIQLNGDIFSEEERAEYFSYNRSVWENFSIWFFLSPANSPRLFVNKTWWGRRIIINLENGRLIADTAKYTESCDEFEKNWIRKHLNEAIATAKDWAGDGSEYSYPQTDRQIRNYRAAVYQAGKRSGKDDCMPLLRALEKIEYCDSSGGYTRYEPKTDGEPDPGDIATNSFRQLVHLSIRRLGEFPKILPCTQVGLFQKKPSGKKYYPSPTLKSQERESRVAQIKAGMSPKELLDLIGNPDLDGHSTWTYDIDSEIPYSLHIYFDEAGVYSKTLEYPPGWKQGHLREKKFSH